MSPFVEPTHPSILVGIVTWNRADILPKALASALAQGVTVAVTDDASTDSTPDLAARFPQVRWVRRPTNQGYMSARNEWMSESGCDFFVSLDDDAWFLQGDEIDVAVRYLQENPTVGAVAFDILSPDRPDAMPRSSPEPTATFIGCGHVLRLAAVRQVGAYESTPGSYGGEEKDLCLRLMDAGFTIVLLPGVHVWHDKSAVARHLPAQHRSGVCNDLVMALRRTPLALLPLALASKFYRHLVFSLRNGLMRPCLAGIGLFLRSIPVVWRSRRPVRVETLRAFLQLSRAPRAVVAA